MGVLSLCLCLLLTASAFGMYDDERAITRLQTQTFSETALIGIARSSDRPYPHSETFISFIDNTGAPCGSREAERYRRADGVCNNLRNPFQGAALDSQRRLFSNTYHDGRRIPTILAKDGKALPSARAVSNQCFVRESDGADGNGANNRGTQMVWQFGQFLAHDLTHIEKVEGSNECCEHFDRRYEFEALFSGDPHKCFPMLIPVNDTFFTMKCMVNSRSYAVDINGINEPINAVTSYIDASVVYGSSVLLLNQLRTGVGGRLNVTRGNGLSYLPGSQLFPCTRPSGITECPLGGDVRVSDQPGLAAMHTMFHLEHNRIAEELSLINRHWDDERLFQESRKVLTGIMQKITFEDYLPVVMGHDVMDLFHLNDDYYYDDTIDAAAILDFTTSGMRFGHTLLNDKLEGINLSDRFLEPVTTANPNYPNIPFSQTNFTCHEFNNGFTDQILDNLFKGVDVEGFSPAPGPSFDLAALNIHRGRDHGIAKYKDVRDMCMKEMGTLYGSRADNAFCSDAYTVLDDQDLFVGGVTEDPLENGILGPTFACMMANQFQKLKFGDRFFWESEGIEGFTEDQRTYIRRNTLASIMCSLDTTEYVQRNVLIPTDSGANKAVSCDDILSERNGSNGMLPWLEDSAQLQSSQEFLPNSVRDLNSV